MTDDALHFSLSHAGGTVMVAVSADRPVGVDLEDAGRPLDVLAAARGSMPEAFAGALAALPQDVRRP